MSHELVSIVSTPLIRIALTTLRNPKTSSVEFRAKLSSITTFLIGKAAESFRTLLHEETICGRAFNAETIEKRLAIVPILRSGSGMLDAALQVLPDHVPVYHLGMYREASTLQATEYYNKLPQSRTADMVLILDPLLATGSTAIAAVQSVTSWGVPEQDITFVCVLATRPGLARLRKACPKIRVVLVTSDDELTDKGQASPGLGDVGDRLYKTSS